MSNERMAAEFCICTSVLSELLMTRYDMMIIQTRKTHTCNTGTLFSVKKLTLLQHQKLDMPNNLNVFKQRNSILRTMELFMKVLILGISADLLCSSAMETIKSSSYLLSVCLCIPPSFLNARPKL